MNRDLELLGKDANKFLICEMSKLIIPKNLKYQAKVKHVDKGGKNLCNEEGIIDLCQDIKEVFLFPLMFFMIFTNPQYF